MSYTTQQDILDFVEDNNVKFVRFAFCDIFGNQKNVSLFARGSPCWGSRHFVTFIL